MDGGLGRFGVALGLAWLGLVVAGGVRAHEIPTDVTIELIAKPGPDRFELLVRVPLEAMQDLTFPTRGPGYLDIALADRTLREAAEVWLAGSLELYDRGTRLARPRVVAVRASLPSDRSFAAYDTARAHLFAAPLPVNVDLPWQQALLDVLLEVPMEAAGAETGGANFALRAGFERLGLRVTTVIRYLPADGRLRVFDLHDEWGLVPLEPRWHESAARFLRAGFAHILDGVDHLLFLVCLVLPLRRNPLALVLSVTAFTVAHSVTLAAAVYGLAPATLWFAPLIETLIAASIFYMALENIVAERIGTRWLTAAGFGLIHGFGFSFALQDSLQFAGEHGLIAVLSFNLGVELGQLLVLVALVPLLQLVFRWVVRERIGMIIVSVIVAHTAWHWLAERYAVLDAYPVGVMGMLSEVFASGAGWLLVGILGTGLAGRALWLARRRRADEAPLGIRSY